MKTPWLGLLAVLLLSSCDRATSLKVTKAEIEKSGYAWPLAVDDGEIGCDGLATWFRAPDGTKYGLNGLAEGRYASIRRIWKDDPEAIKRMRKAPIRDDGIPLKVDIGVLIDKANKLCE